MASPTVDAPAAGESPPGPGASAEAFAGKVFAALLGALETQAIYLGDKLGYYRALDDHGALTAPALASITGTHPRYAREWLEHQAVNGYVLVDEPRAAPDARQYTLTEGAAAVLARDSDLTYMAPFASLAAATASHLDALVHAYRTGGGVSWKQLGDDAREGQGAANKPLYLGPLVNEYIPSLGAIHERLSAGAAVADIGCGTGWSSIAMATRYPASTIDGYDIDEASIEQARRNARASGNPTNLGFHLGDAAEAGQDGHYDLVCAFECIHDMPDPVSVLATMRRMAKPGGTVMIMDEKVAEAFTAPGDDTERLMYGFSILCCLPDGMSHQPSVGTGTVMRPSTLEAYGRSAGFDGLEVLPLDNDFFRFYRLILPEG
ncbi:class I SAM-dependent methyltransferase [Lolliginicoccus lacisalsi]|uniref:class I SAM-dependent methyltransferase n=1 Tax=Lolliginicoccus lacisalsi TaxID=2742202 RepID=UPI002FD1D044